MPHFRGLNLTFEVREGIIKHSHDYTAAEHPELAEYLLDQRPPLEAQLIDLTDEIAYNTADLDDGYEARIPNGRKDSRRRAGIRECFSEAERLYPDAIEKLQFNEALRRMLNRMVDDLITNTQRRITASGVQTIEDVRRYPERWPPSARKSTKSASVQAVPLSQSLLQRRISRNARSMVKK